MTELLTLPPAFRDLAGRCCDAAPCFRARLEAAAGSRQVRVTTELCGQHLGAAVHELARRARSHGLRGQIIVLAVDRPAPPGATRAAGPGGQIPSAFPFSTVRLDPEPPG